MTPEEIGDRLRSFIAAETAADFVELHDLHRLAGGASRETWSFDAEIRGAGRSERLALVLRRDPPGQQIESSRSQEFKVLAAAHEAGVPVPRVRWLGTDPAVLGSSFIVMDRIEGEAIARRLLRDGRYAEARRVMPAELGETAARIHAIPLERVAFLARPPAGVTAAEDEIDRWTKTYDAIAYDPHPAIELGLRWCVTHLPSPGPLTLVHGDYRVGNVMFGPEGLRAILDWELAHLGDPLDDLGWLCVRAWRFGNDAKPVGGLGEREELFEAYERASGKAVDARAVWFWEVFGDVRWAIMTIMQAKTHLDGAVESIELASLGRRTCETEIEILNLIERD